MSRLPFTRHIIPAHDPALSLAINTYRPPLHHQRTTTTAPKTSLLLAHATGLHKELWEPVISRLFNSRIADRIDEVHAWDARNHGDSSAERRLVNEVEADSTGGGKGVPKSKQKKVNWWDLGRDAVKVSEWAQKRAGNNLLVGVGHSIGGCTIFISELLQPTFASMVVVEPIIWTEDELRRMNGSSTADLDDLYSESLVRGAARRKDGFASREDAYNYLISKPFFSVWHPEALQLYLDEGFRQTKTPTDTELRLKCTPNQEAATFAGASTSRHVYPRLHEIQPPVKFLVGKKSYMAMPGYHADGQTDLIMHKHLASKCRDARFEWIDAGHMVVTENPDRTAEEIVDMLESTLASKPMSKL
ncbi:hypothetical protein HK104_010872 [Borealophlyctis nickersoniae]|nr:hypothetical protein HK104_010872 [Borealophlyctis nickersoniae]